MSKTKHNRKRTSSEKHASSPNHGFEHKWDHLRLMSEKCSETHESMRGKWRGRQRGSCPHSQKDPRPPWLTVHQMGPWGGPVNRKLTQGWWDISYKGEDSGSREVEFWLHLFPLLISGTSLEWSFCSLPPRSPLSNLLLVHSSEHLGRMWVLGKWEERERHSSAFLFFSTNHI